jgi:hypothetical protein
VENALLPGVGRGELRCPRSGWIGSLVGSQFGRSITRGCRSRSRSTCGRAEEERLDHRPQESTGDDDDRQEERVCPGNQLAEGQSERAEHGRQKHPQSNGAGPQPENCHRLTGNLHGNGPEPREQNQVPRATVAYPFEPCHAGRVRGHCFPQQFVL